MSAALNPWRTVQGAAEYCAVSVPTIRRALKSGALRGYRIGLRAIRFRVEDLDQWMTQQAAA